MGGENTSNIVQTDNRLLKNKNKKQSRSDDLADLLVFCLSNGNETNREERDRGDTVRKRKRQTDRDRERKRP